MAPFLLFFQENNTVFAGFIKFRDIAFYIGFTSSLKKFSGTPFVTRRLPK